MAIPKQRSDYKYCYADYLTWPDEERWEIIEGVPYSMSPAPLIKHQDILFAVSLIFGSFLKGKKCRGYIAPVDVILSEADETADDEITTIVQPDFLVVCDSDKIDKKKCKGAPDFCIEILSPSTSYKDETEKLKLYEKHGVKEYWLINPDNETVTVFIHNGKRFQKPHYYESGEIIETALFPGLKIKLDEIFDRG